MEGGGEELSARGTFEFKRGTATNAAAAHVVTFFLVPSAMVVATPPSHNLRGERQAPEAQDQQAGLVEEEARGGA